LQAIGFRLWGDVEEIHGFVDIERTIYEAALCSANDGRLFSLLCGWIVVHGDKVVIEKLMKLQKKENAPWLVAVAVFAVNHGMHKWKRLIRKQAQELFFVSRDSALSQIARKGVIAGMQEQNILLAQNEIRFREDDVLSPKQLAKINRQYRNRFLYGACVRADVITAIEDGTPNPYQIAKKVGCSQGPAYRIMKEYQLAIGAV
jgi:hypothetical protein